MDGEDQYFKKNSSKNHHSAMCQILMDRWKMTLAWRYHGSCKLIALKSHNSYST
jgi:hypothetical protein